MLVLWAGATPWLLHALVDAMHPGSAVGVLSGDAAGGSACDLGGPRRIAWRHEPERRVIAAGDYLVAIPDSRWAKLWISVRVEADQLTRADVRTPAAK